MGIQVESISPPTEEGKQPQKLSHFRKPHSGSSYIQGLKDELKKVTWTTKDELVLCTKVVVGATFCLGIGIYIIDLGIKGFLNGFSGIVHLIFG